MLPQLSAEAVRACRHRVVHLPDDLDGDHSAAALSGPRSGPDVDVDLLMRHLTAAQKGEGGGWHYVTLGRRGGGAIGYCADHEPHATEAEARECYAQYQRDHMQMRAGSLRWTSCDVKGCDQPARNAAQSGGYNFAALCDEHYTAEHARDALGLNAPAGDSWES